MDSYTFANEVDKHVGQRIRSRRESLKISQGRLGRQLGVTFSQIQKYEKGSNRVGAGRLYQIAMFLGVTPNYFFEGLEGEQGIEPQNSSTPSSVSPEELKALTDAFSNVDDKDTRASVVALVRSLMGEIEKRSL
ncbi:helix-turn-helix domain-containing protein [Amaricoccus macauensis]|uniref:helix-turn-helix domain-containing protein n=1 Tax=Amaricoccus macauensis TaxID=57001 RepID=UPI003C7DD107